MQTFLGCQYEDCRAECVTLDTLEPTACAACIQQHCRELDDACIAHAC